LGIFIHYGAYSVSTWAELSGPLHLLLNEVLGLRAVGVDVLGGKGAPPGLQGADPGLNAGNVDGCGCIGEVGVAGLQCVGDGSVFLQGAFEYAGQGLPSPDAHPDRRSREAVKQHRQQRIAR